ncbi:MAG: hypothetical protein JRI68_27235, partial [Deltaproteobacteria bacterium]|nr:hypothetical protein [Deltaproteobacteria bacterium]
MSVRNLGPLVRHAALLGVAGALLASSCILDREGGLSVGGGGTGNSGGTGGVGGVAQCNTIDDCPDPESQCEAKSCAGGWCGLHPLVQGSSCHEDDGQVCDGEGNCVKTEGVECVEPGECV